MRIESVVTLDRALAVMVTEDRANNGQLDRWLPAVIAGFGVERGSFVIPEDKPLHYQPAFQGRPARFLPLLTLTQAAKWELIDEWDESFGTPGATPATWIKVRNEWARQAGLPSRSFNSFDKRRAA